MKEEKEVVEKEVVEKEVVNEKNKYNALDLIRYVVGVFSFVAGMIALSIFDLKLFGILLMLFGFFITPIIYNGYLSRKINNKDLDVLVQIGIPFSLFVLIIFGQDIFYDIQKDLSESNVSVQEKALNFIKSKMDSEHQLDSYELNEETEKYDFKIKYTKPDLFDATCVTNIADLFEDIEYINGINSIQYECINYSGTFLYIKLHDFTNPNNKYFDDYAQYYDKNYKPIKTNLDEIKNNITSSYKKICKSHDYRELLRNPSNYYGIPAYWFGEIVQVVDKNSHNSVFRINVNCEKNSYLNDYLCDDTIYVTYYGSQSFIEDDMVKMWGTMEGNKTYTTIFGASVTIPKFDAMIMELQK